MRSTVHGARSRYFKAILCRRHCVANHVRLGCLRVHSIRLWIVRIWTSERTQSPTGLGIARNGSSDAALALLEHLRWQCLRDEQLLPQDYDNPASPRDDLLEAVLHTDAKGRDGSDTGDDNALHRSPGIR